MRRIEYDTKSSAKWNRCPWSDDRLNSVLNRFHLSNEQDRIQLNAHICVGLQLFLWFSEMRAIVGEAHRYGLRVTAHSTDKLAVYNAVVAGVDGIEHAYDVVDSTLELMARRHVILVPTDGDNYTLLTYAKIAYPNDKEAPSHIEQARNYAKDRLLRAIKEGVLIASGLDDCIDLKLPYGEPSKRVIIGYCEAGVSTTRALRAATTQILALGGRLKRY